MSVNRASIRLLAKTSGYTSDPRRALPDEPEAISEHDEEALERRRAQLHLLHASERAQLLIAVRLERARAQAKLKGIDIRLQVFALQRAMWTGRSEWCIEQRVRVVERRAFGDRAA